MHTSVTLTSASRFAAARYLFCLRPLDVLVLQGSPLLGAAFALRHPAAEQIGPLAILVAANLCLVAHIFVLNDWSNLTADLNDPNRVADAFTARGVGHKEMGALAGGLLLLSLMFFRRLGTTTFEIALGIVALSALYSLPPFNWKGRPLLSSAAHVAGGLLHFLLGYSLGHVFDRRGLLTAAFFALTFAAGHFRSPVNRTDDVRRVVGRRGRSAASRPRGELQDGCRTAQRAPAAGGVLAHGLHERDTLP